MVLPRRIEAGTGEVTTAAGEGVGTVEFDIHFDKAPSVVATLAEDPGAGKRGLVWVHSITSTGFSFEIDSDVANDTYTFNWIAIERRSSEKAGQ